MYSRQKWWWCKITDDFKEKEDQLFLELIAKNVWKARREGAIFGVVYTVLIVALLWAIGHLTHVLLDALAER